jgi:hypothetical protein
MLKLIRGRDRRPIERVQTFCPEDQANFLADGIQEGIDVVDLPGI